MALLDRIQLTDTTVTADNLNRLQTNIERALHKFQLALQALGVFGPSGPRHAEGIVPDPGATAGATKFLREDATWQVPGGGGGGGLGFTDFTKDLGTSNSSGHFDLTGLSGLTAGKDVLVVQTAQPIASKGNARDEFEMDNIEATGYVVDAATIRVYWHAPSVVVGIYAFAYQVSA